MMNASHFFKLRWPLWTLWVPLGTLGPLQWAPNECLFRYSRGVTFLFFWRFQKFQSLLLFLVIALISFWLCWPCWAPLGTSWDPWAVEIVSRGAYLNTLEGWLCCFWLALLDWHPSLAGIFSALWHIVTETPTNIFKGPAFYKMS